MKTTQSLHDALQRQTRDKGRDYCVLAICRGGRNDYSLLVTSHKKVVVFDTPAVAQDFIPILGGGRITQWSVDKESAYWLPLEPNGINRIAILTGYDPYHAPPHSVVPSEKPLKSWRHHIMFSVWYNNAFVKEAADGTLYNEVDAESGLG